ncbi:MAG: hypothetical protein GY788_29530 [bacterium]|nr:hypothetical protein [bacterium]
MFLAPAYVAYDSNYHLSESEFAATPHSAAVSRFLKGGWTFGSATGLPTTQYFVDLARPDVAALLAQRRSINSPVPIEPHDANAVAADEAAGHVALEYLGDLEALDLVDVVPVAATNRVQLIQVVLILGDGELTVSIMPSEGDLGAAYSRGQILVARSNLPVKDGEISGLGAVVDIDGFFSRVVLKKGSAIKSRDGARSRVAEWQQDLLAMLG